MFYLKSQTEAVIDVLACRSEPEVVEIVRNCAQTDAENVQHAAQTDEAAEARTESRRRRRAMYLERKQQAAECFEHYGQTIPLMSALVRSACLAGDDRGAFTMAAAMFEAVVRTRYTAVIGARYGKLSLTVCIAKLAGGQHISEETAIMLIDAAQVVAKVQAATEKHSWFNEHAAYIASVAGMFAEGVEPVVPRSRRRWAIRSNVAAAVALEAYQTDAARTVCELPRNPR